ncbi:MAG: hypothetical protein ACO1NQ_10235 [Flavobacteriales bacterium]
MKHLKHIPLIALLAFVLVSCSKEDAVEPCKTGTTTEEVNAKSDRRPVVIDAGDQGTAPEGVTEGTPTAQPDPGPPGTSDDGDDISDGEKSRKKRR